ADRIIAVSEFNKREIITNCKIPSDRISMIYHGIPLCSCGGAENIKKERSVLTVGNIIENNLKRKGLATFIKAAAMLPEIKFFMVGYLDKRMARYLQGSVTDNVIITGRVSNEVLCQFYSRATVYVQVSYHEQFGRSLAEAMAHRCVPVVTSTSALPEVVGQAGYYVPYDDAGELSRAIIKALDDTQTGALAQERVKELFSFAARKQALCDLVEQVCREGKPLARKP
ncbi:MAG: glycosyltransferase, partial [Candidatus Omnitrophica bacterium]|nr:glycosyltransferase [Candidatus Omnitrophota bacterium]